MEYEMPDNTGSWRATNLVQSLILALVEEKIITAECAERIYETARKRAAAFRN
jgi:hypothetical protein